MRDEKYRRELTAFRAFAMEKFKDGRNQVEDHKRGSQLFLSRRVCRLVPGADDFYTTSKPDRRALDDNEEALPLAARSKILSRRMRYRSCADGGQDALFGIAQAILETVALHIRPRLRWRDDCWTAPPSHQFDRHHKVRVHCRRRNRRCRRRDTRRARSRRERRAAVAFSMFATQWRSCHWPPSLTTNSMRGSTRIRYGSLRGWNLDHARPAIDSSPTRLQRHPIPGRSHQRFAL
jgi:hypothetical protein